jgi:hypothetical protein
MKLALSMALTLTLAIVLANVAHAEISYTGGDGSSIEQAVVIVGAVNEYDGVDAEYQWLAQKFGTENENWTSSQGFSQSGNKLYDILTVNFLKDVPGHKAGESTDFYFDITAFFGKF